MPAAFVFIQEGCGACEAFLPTFNRVADRYRRSFPIHVYDLAKADHHVRNFANTMMVRATPTTIVLDSTKHLHRIEGAAGAREVDQLLRRAL